MDLETGQVVVPDYLLRFACIRDFCIDNCCQIDWEIPFDNQFLFNISTLTDPQLRQRILAGCQTETDCGGTRRAGLLRRKPDGGCCFLSENYLCSLQSALGENYLPEICRTYPRIDNVIDGVREQSLAASCPEAARLILTNQAGIEFVVVNQSECVKADTVRAEINTSQAAQEGKPEEYFHELRGVAFGALKDRRCSVAARMLLLNDFCQQVYRAIIKGRVREIPFCIAEFKSNAASKLDALDTSAFFDFQVELLRELLNPILLAKVRSERYRSVLKELQRFVDWSEACFDDRAIERFCRSRETVCDSLLGELDYLMENYLVNRVFGTLFPFVRDSSVLSGWLDLAVHFSLIEFHLIAAASFDNNFNEQAAINVIQACAREFEHDLELLATIVSKVLRKRFG